MEKAVTGAGKPLPRGQRAVKGSVDSVTTVSPGQPASVTVSIIGTVLHLSLALQEGQPKTQGVQGQLGQPGQQGTRAV